MTSMILSIYFDTHPITGQPPSQVYTFLGVGSSETIHLLPPTYCTVKPPIIHYPL